MGDERVKAFKEEIEKRPIIDQEAGEAPGRVEVPDYVPVVDVEAGKASLRLDRLMAEQDIKDSADLADSRSAIHRIKDTVHERIEQEKEDERAIEELTPPSRIERQERQAKAAARNQRKGAIRSFFDSFKRSE
jgi:hypothetical protein